MDKDGLLMNSEDIKSIEKCVQVIYDFDGNEYEFEALGELLGGMFLVKAIISFKNNKRPPSEAVKFLIKIGDYFNIIGLLSE